MIEYKYTIITRDGQQFGLDPRFWDAHPDWDFVVRTDRRYKPTSWITGGGKTLAEAVSIAEFGIRHCYGKDEVCAGTESETPIQNQPEL